MANIINGKEVSAATRAIIQQETERITEEFGRAPGLAVIIVGEDPASKVYVRNKHKACLEVGIRSFEITLPAETTEEELITRIDELNASSEVDGILVQLPLPRHINEDHIINAIRPDKDVDAFHPINVGKILTGKYEFLPCTPAGIMTLIDYYGIEVEGKRCVVVGRSNIVGKPMGLLLLERNGTVTICHSRTHDLASVTRTADILVVAVGRPNFISGDMIKDGAVVIDVGINRLADGKLVGDVDFESASSVASMITPVPGGVGPMTITTLLKNTLAAARMHFKH